MTEDQREQLIDELLQAVAELNRLQTGSIYQADAIRRIEAVEAAMEAAAGLSGLL